MKIRTACLLLIVAFLLSACSQSGEKAASVQVIDGIEHIMNPAEPAKGTVTLRLEKSRLINPYERDDVGMKFFFAARSSGGEVILFDPNNIEAHRYGADNAYLGNMVKKGQGPGEFQQYRGLRFHFMGEEIWASSNQKVARYDKGGTYLGEDRIGSNRSGPDQFIDGQYYLCEKSEWTDAGQKRRICIESLTEEGPEARSQVLFELTKEEWMIRKDRSAFADSWSCPSLLFTYSPETRTVFYALNQAYQIHAADPEGTLVRVIHRVHQPVKVGPKDKEQLASWALRNEQSRWILDAYPDTLNALLSLKILPNGWLAAFRISGPKEITFDVFDREGRYIYALELPRDEQMKHLLAAGEQIGFFESGLFTQEILDDLPVYVEYRITNLPDIFR